MSKQRKRKPTQPKATTPQPQRSLAPTPKTFFERLPWQVGALTLLVAITYASSLGGQFVYDDSVFLGDHAVNGPGFGREAFLLTQARPLTFLTFHWNYLASGQNPMSWHAVNVLIHVANCVLLLLIARRHLSSVTALIAAALYAVHPLNTEAVSYVYQRSTALATLFALLSFLLFLKEEYAWSAGAFGLSLLCKEETIALPVFLLLYDLIYRRRRPRLVYYAVLLGLAGLAVAHSFYVWRLPIRTPTIGFRTKGVTELSFILTEPRVVWTYLRLFLVPVGQNVDHDVRLSHGLLSPWVTLPALLGLATLIGLLGYLAWRGNRLAFWGLSFFVLLAPTSSLVPVRDLMFEHRVYFPSICLVMAAAMLLARLPRRAAVPAVAAILIALLAATVVRNRVWHDGISLWADAIQKSPNKARPYSAMARLLVGKGEVRRAREYLERACAIEPDDSGLHNDLGVAAMLMGDLPPAAEHLRRAVALEPDNATYRTDLGVALMRLRDNRDALDQFQRAITLDGPKADRLTYLGEAYSRSGQLDRAVEAFRRALGMNPCIPRTRTDLVRALNAQGKTFEAAAASQRPPECGQGRE